MAKEPIGDWVPILTIGNIHLQNGGLHKAIYRRLGVFSELCKEVVLLTTQYDSEMRETLHRQRSLGNIPSNVRVLNLYTDGPSILSGPRDNQSDTTNAPTVNPLEGKGVSRFRDLASSQVGYRCFVDGKYERYELYDGSGRLRSIDHFTTPWVRTQKTLLTTDGRTECVRHMDRSTNRSAFEQYFGADGHCELSISRDTTSGKEKHFFLHDSGQQYTSIEDFMAVVIRRLCETTERPVVFVDKREWINPVLDGLQGREVPFIYVLHSTHLGRPYTDPSVLEPSIRPLFERASEFWRIIVLTDRQKEDMVRQFGLDADKICVIPHPQQPVPVDLRRPGHSRPAVAVSVSRLHGAKALHEAIEAFSVVAREIPDAQYDIYGYGDMRGSLQQLIDQLELQEQVKLRGFAHEPLSALSSARVSILTSLYEGFSLAVTESLACGTPVVTYDTKYGPSSIVRNGVDGFVVPWGDKDALATKIIDLFNDEHGWLRMSNQALEVTSRFSEANVRTLWVRLIQELSSCGASDDPRGGTP